ncbi:MAG: hypothetical protein R2780_00545 [Crocinitomicaceae bacterium]
MNDEVEAMNEIDDSLIQSFYDQIRLSKKITEKSKILVRADGRDFDPSFYSLVDRVKRELMGTCYDSFKLFENIKPDSARQFLMEFTEIAGKFRESFKHYDPISELGNSKIEPKVSWSRPDVVTTNKEEMGSENESTQSEFKELVPELRIGAELDLINDRLKVFFEKFEVTHSGYMDALELADQIDQLKLNYTKISNGALREQELIQQFEDFIKRYVLLI